MQKKTKVLFAGSGSFSWPVLQGIVESSQFELVGIITQPHKPQGRDQILLPAYLEQAVLNNAPELLDDVPIYRPEKLKLEAENILHATQPDLMVVAAYGQIIPNLMLNFSELGCVNFHGSLLPKLRGAVPVPMAILQDLKQTGVTLQQVVAALDAGDIIAARTHEITPDETADSLMTNLAQLAKQMVGVELVDYVQGVVDLVPQNESEATYCYEADLSKDKAEITTSVSAEVAERMVRAFNPWPVAWAQINIANSVKRLKIYRSTLASNDEITGESGTITRKGKELYLVLQAGTLSLQELQLEGKKQGNAADYLFLDGATIST